MSNPAPSKEVIMKGCSSPPDGWSCVDDAIYRANTILPSHFPFLKCMGIRSVVNVTSPSKSLQLAADSSSILLIEFNSTSTIMSDTIAQEVIAFTMCPLNQPLLISASSPGCVEVATIVGCLRRINRWNITAIMNEFRLYLRDMSPILDINRIFIERFDVSLISVRSGVRSEICEEESDDWTRDGHPGTAPLKSSKVTADLILLVHKDDD